MASSKYEDRYFYFRTQANEEDDDDINASLMLPISEITGIGPVTGITNCRIWFKSAHTVKGSADVLGGQNGYVDLTVTRGKIKEVIHSLVSAMNAGPHHDGVTVVADKSTTDYDDSTRSSVFLTPDITDVSIVVG